MIRRLINYIRSPDAYPGRPWAYLANQVGHTALGALLVGLPVANGLVIILIYIALIELPQATLWGGSVSDGIEDTAHVAAGVLAVTTGWSVLILLGSPYFRFSPETA